MKYISFNYITIINSNYLLYYLYKYRIKNPAIDIKCSKWIKYISFNYIITINFNYLSYYFFFFNFRMEAGEVAYKFLGGKLPLFK